MLWGGRFDKAMDDFFLNYSSSIHFDINLIKYDLMVSRAHAKMLGKTNIIDKKDSDKIIKGLHLIEAQFVAGNWNPLDGKYEDIHSAIESYLNELIGETAGKLHTGRSRNDQVATGFRMWIKDSSQHLINELIELQKVFIELAEKHIDTIIPGYTHLQRAQPISFAFHLLAYVEMFERDKHQLKKVIEESDVCPLGSGALAGSTLKLDRKMVAKELGFKKVSANALDSVADRDFVISFLNACVVGMMHFSRLCEELIIWSSSEFAFIQLDDSVTTGSSLMPQKKNPDAAELVRGKFGRVQGNYIAVSTMMKGLPLSYNRDMQEDKEPVFDSFKTFSESLQVIKLMMSNVIVDEKRFTKELNGSFMLATDIADWLVVKGVPFRQAHEIVGKTVRYAISKKKKLNQLSLKELKKISSVYDATVKEFLNIDSALERKKNYGSPNPNLVLEQIKELISKLNSAK